MSRRVRVDVRWRDLDPEDVSDGVLRPGATFVDCARSRPFDEALSVADSALRHGDLTAQGMLGLAEQVPTTGRTQCLRVAREASGLAANPFESVPRAIAVDVPGLDLRPQLLIAEDGWSGWPDLVDRSVRLVVEADSFEFHGRRTARKRDCERYNALVVRGRVVLRFPWEHVMFEPTYVRGSLARWTQRQEASRSRRRSSV
jgi:hypothetical protein